MKKVFQKTPSRILFTQDGYNDVLKQKAKLLSERPLAVENLRKSRELGDLSENGYYKASRARLSFIDGRLRRLEKLVRLGKIIEHAKNGVIGFGSKVVVSNENGLQTYTIVGGYESDPKSQTISLFSPLGKALLGKKAGDSVLLQLPKGEVTYAVVSIE